MIKFQSLLWTFVAQFNKISLCSSVCVDDEKKLDTVMASVENYYQQLELTAIRLKRRIYVSSENDLMPQLIKKTYFPLFQKSSPWQFFDVRYPHFDVLSASVEDVANDSSSEFSDFHRELLDVHFLSKSDFIVCAKSPRVMSSQLLTFNALCVCLLIQL